MRYRCHECGQLIKDKFLFGLLHFCLNEEERQLKRRAERNAQMIQYHQQQSAQKSTDEWVRDILGQKP